MDYLEAARKKFGKISVIVDRAPQSKCCKKISAQKQKCQTGISSNLSTFEYDRIDLETVQT